MPDSRRSPRLISAYKHGWPRLAVHAMILRKTRRTFFRVRAQGVERLRDTLDAEPGGTLFLANHSCWWDLFLAHVLNESIPLDGYGMMEHFNMRRFGFFRRIGAFSVDRTDPTSVRASINYAVGLLEGPRAGVWIFPQGRMVGNDVRPLGFQHGLRSSGPARGGYGLSPRRCATSSGRMSGPRRSCGSARRRGSIAASGVRSSRPGNVT